MPLQSNETICWSVSLLGLLISFYLPVTQTKSRIPRPLLHLQFTDADFRDERMSVPIRVSSTRQKSTAWDIPPLLPFGRVEVNKSETLEPESFHQGWKQWRSTARWYWSRRAELQHQSWIPSSAWNQTLFGSHRQRSIRILIPPFGIWWRYFLTLADKHGIGLSFIFDRTIDYKLTYPAGLWETAHERVKCSLLAAHRRSIKIYRTPSASLVKIFQRGTVPLWRLTAGFGQVNDYHQSDHATNGTFSKKCRADWRQYSAALPHHIEYSKTNQLCSRRQSVWSKVYIFWEWDTSWASSAGPNRHLLF